MLLRFSFTRYKLLPVIEAEGYRTLLEAIFGNNTLVNVSMKSFFINDPEKYFITFQTFLKDVFPILILYSKGLAKFLMEDVVKTHPIVISQDFIPNPYTSDPHTIENFTADGLAKLFAYGSYARARMEQNETSMESILGTELEKYPYAKKEVFQEPYFSPVDLSGLHESDFHTSLTDSGVCMVYNGNTLKGTYRPSKRVDELSEAFDRRGTTQSKKIEGTGRIFEKVFWINVQDRLVNLTMVSKCYLVGYKM